MPRFTLVEQPEVAHILFDDGGMNLLSSDALHELRALIEQLRANSRARRRLLTFRSSHARLFAAGADMAEMQRFTWSEANEFARVGQELFAEIERLPILTLAMIDGDCFGGALDLVLAFDLRFATPRSRFSHPGARLGIATGFGGTTRWRKAIDRAAARSLFLGNDVLTAADAAEIGIVDRVFESLDESGPEIERLLTLDPRVTAMVKELSRHASRLSQRELLLVSKRLREIYS
ncbi:MAG TPA: enoyl-CoA hydratase/isomerase family protein [Thermoanaerobaculia bacterium]|nr:enoyl-CoA hydratase/isomerase family protein [Thermoanaerobaculia bacterium]